jgi:hypothetical protein
MHDQILGRGSIVAYREVWIFQGNPSRAPKAGNQDSPGAHSNPC